LYRTVHVTNSLSISGSVRCVFTDATDEEIERKIQSLLKTANDEAVKNRKRARTTKQTDPSDLVSSFFLAWDEKMGVFK